MILECGYRVSEPDSLINRRHTHDGQFEMIQVISGEGNIMIRDRLYPFEQSAIFLINSMDIHCSVTKDGSPYVRNKLILDSRELERLASSIDMSDALHTMFYGDYQPKLLLAPESIAAADRIFNEISALYESKSGRQSFAIYSSVLSLLQLLACGGTEPSGNISGTVPTALEYINSHISEELTLEKISAAVFTDKYYLCKLFRKDTGTTVCGYIKARRLSLAKHKLRYTDMPVSEISGSCGFSCFSYFSNLFKASEGITPSEYRKTFRQ